MADEQKDQAVTEKPEQVVDQNSGSDKEETEEQPTAAAQDKESPEEEVLTNNHIAQKRGRMVAAGVIAAVILSGIAVGVAGIFQFTAARLMSCPQDLPVNDPAPILWKDVVETKGPNASLGVPAKLAKEVALKGIQEASK